MVGPRDDEQRRGHGDGDGRLIGHAAVRIEEHHVQVEFLDELVEALLEQADIVSVRENLVDLVDPASGRHDPQLAAGFVGGHAAHRLDDLAVADEIVGERPARDEPAKAEEPVQARCLDIGVHDRDTPARGGGQQCHVRGGGGFPRASPIGVRGDYAWRT